ncbi:MAG: hypothetical protein JRI68_01635 [Deltaproteobacteria bacterium]|nr:hypothetical protein [Deltaproteobacteria bacterium]
MVRKIIGSTGLAVLLLAAWACGEDEEAPGCTPGQVVSCPCAEGQGTQTCLSDGTGYGPCMGCADDDLPGVGGGDGPGLGGGSSGTGGVGGGPSTPPEPEPEHGTGSGNDIEGPPLLGDLICIDLEILSPTVDFPACDVADQNGCACEGCTYDGICFEAGQQLADDCVCGDCATDDYCSNPANCADDGICDPYFEGCVCADCAAHPACS